MGLKHPHIGIDDLRTLNPQAAAEWDDEKNVGLNILDYVAGSAKRVWWTCAKCHHKWQSAIRDRFTRGSGCPKCAQAQRGENRIAAIIKRKGSFSDPKLILDWSPHNNLGPESYSKCSNRVVEWKCHICGFEWKSKISNRVHGRNCPACSRKAIYVGHNDLATTHPELAKEWHPTKNGDLKPTDVIYGQAQKVWWLCPNGHSYLASLNKRSSDKTGCSVCNAGRQTSFREQAFFYYITKLYPNAVSRYKPEWLGRMELDIYIPELKIAIEYDGAAWHKEKNADREARKYNLCKKNDIKLWRIKEDSSSHKPGIADQIFSVPNVETEVGFRALLILVLSALDSTCNMWTRRNPRKVCTDIDVNLDRDRYKINKYRYAVPNSLASKRPDIAATWHPTKNHDWRPEGLSWKSERKVWWICAKCGGEYEMTIAHRVAGSGGCPNCARKEIGEKRRRNKLKRAGLIQDEFEL